MIGLRFVHLVSCAVLIMAASAWSGETTASMSVNSSFFAINGTKLYQIPDQIDSAVQKRFGWMKELGVQWDRSDLWWHTVEPTPGKWTWEWPDRVMAEYEKQGVQWYPILCYGAAWWKDHNGPRNDAELKQWAEYVSRTVGRYKGRVPYWSVWNEPNIADFWKPAPSAEDYARLLKVTREAVKQADPAAKLCAPAVAPLQGWDRKFVERLYQLGCKDSFDVFDYHYYRNDPPEDEVPQELAAIRAVMARYGDSKPIWVSESGVNSPINRAPASYDRQAALVVRNQLLCSALGVERFFYFDLQNWFDDPDKSWDSTLGLVEAGGTRKPSFHAYKTMVRETGKMDPVGRILSLGPDVQGVLFHNKVDDSYLLAAWLTSASTTTVQIPVVGASARVVEPYGEERSVAAAQGKAGVALDSHPRYISKVDPAMLLPEAGVQLVPAMTIIAAGESKPLSIQTSRLLTSVRIDTDSKGLPQGLTWDSLPGLLRCTSAASAGRHVLRIKAEVKAGPNGPPIPLELKTIAEVVRPLTVVLRPVTEDGRLITSVTLTSRLTRPVSDPVTLIEDDAATSRTVANVPVESLMPNEVRRVTLPVKEEDLRKRDAAFVWHASFDGTEARTMRFCPVRLLKEAPIVDGDLAEYKSQPALEISQQQQIIRNVGTWSPENASARVWVRFTPDTMYLAAQVRDNDPMVNDMDPIKMYGGDALELYIGFRGPTGRTVINKEFEYQLGLAPTSKEGRPVVFWFHKDVELTNAKIVAKKTSDGYTMEAAIPLADIKAPTDTLRNGAFIGLDAVLDDLDRDDWAPAGNDRGRALSWNGLPSNWIDPSNWGIGIIRGER